jgi:flagellar hook protein FlgE
MKSLVETVASLRNLRSFQVNVRMIRAQDDMLGTLLDVRR